MTLQRIAEANGHLLQQANGLSAEGVTRGSQVRGNMENSPRSLLFPPREAPLSYGHGPTHALSRSASSPSRGWVRCPVTSPRSHDSDGGMAC